MKRNKPTEPKTDATGNRAARLRILDKEVQIGCKPGEEEDLLEAAAYIDQSMRQLRQRSSTSSIEKIAIVTAINTASALLKARAEASQVAAEEPRVNESDMANRIAQLNSKLDDLLGKEVEIQTVPTE